MSAPVNPFLFALLRALSDGRFHSGQLLAQNFNLSRSSICNIVAEATELGVRIQAVQGRGYRMPVPPIWLDQHQIIQRLADTPFNVQCVEVLASTNASLMQEALDGAPDGRVLCTELQLAGRGRRGRGWNSALGGSLMFSVLCRFDAGLSVLSGLSLAAGLAVVRAINRYSAHGASLKWPNDVLVNHRKLAGILVEVQGDMNGPAFAVVGIGLNVHLPANMRENIDQAVIDFDEMGVTIDRNQLLVDCLHEFHDVLKAFRGQGFVALREAWMALDAYAGRPVKLLRSGQPEVTGIAAGVDGNGALLVRDADGTRAYHGGEISLRLVR
ncbi:MAG: biotin--[acetyl-CoA-carboxylase] ligase [Thiobacillus sp.]